MPLARHDLISSPTPENLSAFLLTCLLRGMTQEYRDAAIGALFLLTCLLRGMTSFLQYLLLYFYVSTHMPLARHDHEQWQGRVYFISFYSHASCEA